MKTTYQKPRKIHLKSDRTYLGPKAGTIQPMCETRAGNKKLLITEDGEKLTCTWCVAIYKRRKHWEEMDRKARCAHEKIIEWDDCLLCYKEAYIAATVRYRAAEKDLETLTAGAPLVLKEVDALMGLLPLRSGDVSFIPLQSEEKCSDPSCPVSEEEEKPAPIGTCSGCGRLKYSELGFCGVCQPSRL